MRRLLVTRGHQGTGKSTFVRELGLDPYRLCADDLRRLLSSPVLTNDGRIGLNQGIDNRVWPMVFQILDERMARGELIVLDATHPSARDLRRYVELAKRHRYEIACVDFSTVPLDQALAWNQRRPPWQVVPEAAIRRTWQACQDGQVPPELTRWTWDEVGSHAVAVHAWLSTSTLDLSPYRRVHHIGDLQGCLHPLLAYLGGPALDADDYWILVGDLCDRGPENGAVVRWALDHALAENVRIHWGNHEDHLHRWAVGQRAVSDEFQHHTLPQLLAAGLAPADVDTLCAALVDETRYRFDDVHVLVTHAGLSTVPEHPVRISTHQYGHGTGSFSDPVDVQFDLHAPAGWFQVHGHRNSARLAVRASERSFNLEESVEYGGRLRIAVLDRSGWVTHRLKNPVFRPFHSRLDERMLPFQRLLPPWVHPEMPDRPVLSTAELEALTGHPLVAVKTSASAPHIGGLNFTRDAFFRGEWDEVNLRARGLFVDLDSGEVVARSYDKFFNVGERPETRPEALAESLAFPVTLWLKENGYLGILGYDSRGDDLFWTSKSTPDSEFAAWFREIGDRAMSPEVQDALRRYLRDTHSALVFEVVDPARDPHIIAYDEAAIVLLECVHRGPTFRALPYDRLVKLAAFLGVPVKQRAMRFDDWASLSRWMEVATAPGWRFKGEFVEGFVIEDAAGFLTKLKLDYYGFWKRLRSLKERVRKIRGTNQGLGRDLSDPRVRAFHDWLVQQPDELLDADIITVRAAFGSGDLPPGMTPRPPPGDPPEQDREIASFRGKLASLAGKPEGYVIPRQTADRIVAECLADDRKLELLAGSPARIAIVLAAGASDDRAELAVRVHVDIA